MSTNEKKNKHMTLDDRVEIQECLCKRTIRICRLFSSTPSSGGSAGR